MTALNDIKHLLTQTVEDIAALRMENQLLVSRIRRLEDLLRAKERGSGEMLCLNEAAALLGKAPKTVRNWRSENKFPKPDKYKRNGSRKRPLWFTDTILDFRKVLEEGR